MDIGLLRSFVFEFILRTINGALVLDGRFVFFSTNMFLQSDLLFAYI